MSSFYLKMIALVTMIIDHTGVVFFSNNLIFRYIGRLAFPIYSFFISQGIKKTSNIKKYLKNLFLLALISEPFYDLYFYGKINLFYKTNTVFTLFFASLGLYFYKKSINFSQKYFSLFLGIFLAYIFKSDYNILGIILIYIFYFNDDKIKNLLYGICWVTIKYSNNLLALSSYNFNTLSKQYIFNIINLYFFTVVPFVILLYYNGKRGFKLKYTFYIMYPLHLFILYIIKILLHK